MSPATVSVGPVNDHLTAHQVTGQPLMATQSVILQGYPHQAGFQVCYLTTVEPCYYANSTIMPTFRKNRFCIRAGLGLAYNFPPLHLCLKNLAAMPISYNTNSLQHQFSPITSLIFLLKLTSPICVREGKK